MSASEQLNPDSENSNNHYLDPSIPVLFTNHAHFRNQQRFDGQAKSIHLYRQISRAGCEMRIGETFLVRIGIASYVCVRSVHNIVVKTIMYARKMRFKKSVRPDEDAGENWIDVKNKQKKKRYQADAERRRVLRKEMRKRKEGG